MKLLIVHRYYWPDTPSYAQMLHIMAKRYVADGHDVSVFSSQPGYNDSDSQKVPAYEEVDGVKIYRSPLLPETKSATLRRALNVLIFCWCFCWHVVFRWNRYDLMTVATFPPTVMGFCARWLCWISRTRYLYHCQDLYPEVAEASRLLKRKWVGRLAQSIDRRNCRNAERVVVLSKDMKATLTARGLRTENVAIINNFIIDELDESVEVPTTLRKYPDKMRILFAGNLGRFQGLEKLLSSFLAIPDRAQVELVFVGGGAMTKRLKEQSGKELGSTVHFHGYQPMPTILKIIQESDLAITSLAEGVIHCAYPSKTMTYMEAGTRTLAILERESELAQMIESHQLGSVCAPEVETIQHALQREIEIITNMSPEEKKTERARIQALGRERFGQTEILEKWSALLKEIGNESS